MTPTEAAALKKTLEEIKKLYPEIITQAGELAEAMAPDLPIKIIGIRPGEKLHEIMCPADDSHLTLEFNDYYVIMPTIKFWDHDSNYSKNVIGENGAPVKIGFEYNSGNNPDFLSTEQIKLYNQQY